MARPSRPHSQPGRRTRRRRLRRTRRAFLTVAGALTLATLLSPWYTLAISGTTWSSRFTNGGLRLWWVDQGRTWGEPGASFRLGTEDEHYSWTWHCAPYVWVPNAWLPAWIPLAPLWGATAIAYVAAFVPRSRGKCPACGYDLAALPAEAGRTICPECGNEHAAGA